MWAGAADRALGRKDREQEVKGLWATVRAGFRDEIAAANRLMVTMANIAEIVAGRGRHFECLGMLYLQKKSLFVPSSACSRADVEGP